MVRTTEQLDNALQVVENIVNNGNIVARSILLEPASTKQLYTNTLNTVISSTSSFTVANVEAKPVYNNPQNFSVVSCNLTGKNLYAIRINDNLSADDLTNMTLVSQNVIVGSNPEFINFIPTVKNTTTSEVLDTAYSTPLFTENVSFVFTSTPAINNYSSTEVNATGLVVIADNTTSATLVGFEAIRANYVDSTLKITVNSTLDIIKTGSGNSIVSATVLNQADNTYVYDTNVNLQVREASLTVVGSNAFSTNISNGDIDVDATAISVRGLFPTTTASLTNLSNASYSLVIESTTNLTYYQSGLNIASGNDVVVSGSLIQTNYGLSQVSIDSNLSVHLGNDLSNLTKITVNDRIPEITGDELSIINTNLSYKNTDFGLNAVSFVDIYHASILRTTSHLNTGTLSNVNAYLIPYNSYNSTVNLSGVSGDYATAQTNYSLLVLQTMGSSLYNNLTLVSDTAIFNDYNAPNMNVINTTFTDVSFTKGIYFNNTGYNTANPSHNGIKYNVFVEGTIVPINDTNTKVLYIDNDTNIAVSTYLYSALLVLDSPLDNRVEFNPELHNATLNNITVSSGTVSNVVGTYANEFGAKFLVPSGLQGSGLVLSRGLTSQVIGDTEIELKLISKDLVNPTKNIRMSLKYTYPSGESDFTIVDYSGTTVNNSPNSDIANIVISNSNLLIPITVDNIEGYYISIALSDIDSAVVGSKSLVILPSTVKAVVKLELYSNDVLISTTNNQNITEPSWDPENMKTVTYDGAGNLTYYLLDQEVNPSADFDGVRNVISFNNSSSSYQYSISTLDANMNENTVETGIVSIDGNHYYSMGSYLTIKFREDFVFSRDDSIDFYYFFNPIVELISSNNSNVVDTGRVYLTSNSQVLNAVNTDGVYLTNWNRSSLTVGTYTFNTIPAQFTLYSNGSAIASNVSANGSLNYLFFSNDSRLVVELSANHIIGVNTLSEELTFYNRSVSVQIVDSSLVPVSGLGSSNYLLFDNVKMYINVDSTTFTSTSSSDSFSSLINTGFTFETINNLGYSSETNKVFYLTPNSYSYKEITNVSQTTMPTQSVGIGFNNNVNAIDVDSEGNLYIGGSFSYLSNYGATAQFVKWNGSSFTNILSVAYLRSGIINDIKVHPITGDVYVCGSAVYDKIAKYSPSTDTWSGLGSGIFGSSVETIAIHPITGDVYVGGTFTSAGGVSVNNIAKWNGTAWSSVGNGDNTGIIYTIAISLAGDIYIGGTMPGGIKLFDGTNFNTIGTGTSGNPFYYVATIDINNTTGEVYIGGWFDSVNGVPASKIAKYNPSTSTWSALGSGLTGINVYSLKVNQSTGEVYVGGSFTKAGGFNSNNIAKWTGTSWQGYGSYGADNNVLDIAINQYGKVYIGGAFNNVLNVLVNFIAQLPYTQITNTYGPVKYIKPSRLVELSQVSSNVVLNALLFRNLRPTTGTFNVELRGDTIAELVLGATTIKENNTLTTQTHSVTNIGLSYTLSQNFFPSNFNVNLVLKKPVITLEVGGNLSYTTPISTDNTNIIGAGYLTGLRVKKNNITLYNLVKDSIYTSVFRPISMKAFNQGGVSLSLRQEGFADITTLGLVLGDNSVLQVYVSQQNDGNENLRFIFNKRAGYYGSISYPLYGGQFILDRYELPMDSNIQSSNGSTGYIFKQESTPFGYGNLDSTGYVPVDYNGSNLHIKINATQSFFTDTYNSSGMYIVVNNDKAPLAIRKTGPNTASKYIVVVANDITNVYQLVASNGVSAGSSSNQDYLNLSSLQIGNL